MNAPRWWGAAAGGVLLLAAAWLLLARPEDRGILEAPRPAAVDSDAADSVPASSLVVPLVIPLDLLVGLLDDAVPRSYGSLDDRADVEGDDRTALAFELARGPFHATMSGDTARVEALVEYSLRAWYDPPVLPELDGSCGTDGEPRPRLRVVYEAPLRLDADWTLSTEAALTTLEPATEETRDRCRMTFLDYDVTGHVVGAARSFLESHEETVDSLAASMALRSSFHDWWETLRNPIQLADSIWLVVGPEAVRRGTVRGSADSVRVELALQARPRIVVGPRPASSATTLPPLETGPTTPGLELRVDGRAEYGTASHFLMEELEGTVVEREGRRLRLDSLRLLGLGDGRVAVEVLTSGDLDARLYMVGTPALDPGTGTVSVPDLDFDVATRNVVLEAASWLGPLGLRTLLRERARWSTGPAEEWLRTWLDRGLNRDVSSSLRVRGAVDTLLVEEIHPLPGALRVRIGARARARVQVLPAPGG